jgi:SAM-dependent methyltransferase
MYSKQNLDGSIDMIKIKSDCPCCSAEDVILFHQVKNVPVNSVLNIFSRNEAIQFPRKNISLRYCAKCGFIYNSEFDPDSVRYSSDCEESQGHSPTFNSFAKNLASELIHKYGLYRKNIVEIGCGKGEFLKLLVDLGQNRGFGFDPAYVPRQVKQSVTDQIRFIPDFYSERYANYYGELICCRMTLEHIYDPAQLLAVVRRSIGDRETTVIFFQVPNMARILKDCAFEDIYYEHCSYFTPGALARLFRSSHFDLLDLKEAYNEQYILIEARPSRHKTASCLALEDDLPSLQDNIKRFQTLFPITVQYWQTKLDEIKATGRRAVVWGSGSKGVTFLNILPNSDFIDYVVDINPYRQGTYMAATGQKIVEPQFLKTYRPDVVIIMNSIYQKEIQKDLQEMQLKPTILGLGINKHQNAGHE